MLEALDCIQKNPLYIKGRHTLVRRPALDQQTSLAMQVSFQVLQRIPTNQYERYSQLQLKKMGKGSKSKFPEAETEHIKRCSISLKNWQEGAN